MDLVDVGTPIVGFRCWVIDSPGEPALRSIAMRYSWPADAVAEAACLNSSPRPTPHVSPSEDCRCGLHARTTIEGCWEEYPYYPVHGYWAYRTSNSSGLMALGAVLLWGTVLSGKRVIRAQYGRVLCLTEKPDCWAKRSGSNDPSAVSKERVRARDETLERISTAYSVPMVPYETVTTYSAEFGDLAE